MAQAIHVHVYCLMNHDKFLKSLRIRIIEGCLKLLYSYYTTKLKLVNDAY